MLSYKMEGIYKSNNNNLPFQNQPTILFRDQADYSYCWGCAMECVGDKFITIEDMFIHWGGDTLYCNRCGKSILSEENK